MEDCGGRGWCRGGGVSSSLLLLLLVDHISSTGHPEGTFSSQLQPTMTPYNRSPRHP